MLTDITSLRRFDAHMHGPISFHEYSLKVQNYKKLNTLQLLAEICFERQIGLCAITSNYEKIERNSIHDRFNFLIQNYANTLPNQYSIKRRGKNIVFIEKEGKTVIFINSQSVIINEDGRLLDHLVVGSNEIDNFISLEEVFKNENLIHIAEHPFSKSHRGIGPELLTKYLDQYDAIEHNSQMIVPYFFQGFPFLRYYSKMMNRLAKEFAEKHQKPFIATSDAHCIEHAGTSYITFNSEPCIENEDSLLRDIKTKIKGKEFTTKEEYIPFFEGASWIIKGKIGEIFDLYK